MSLTIGTKLGPCEIPAPLGAGGMGEVYRARDTRLDRDVALKILPDVFAGDADRLARFEREAKTLASLNHPNVAPIHGLEESGGVRALVMELVEGDDLSGLIARGPIALADALPIAKQIADAIGAIGGSAGGHLVALLATSHKVAELEGAGGHPGVSSRLQAVVAMAPVVDFAAMDPRSAAGSTLFGDKVELAKLLSAVTHVDKDSAPFLLIHGNADATVPIAQSQQVLERGQRAGVPAELLTIDGAPHAFWNMPAWSPDTVERAARFFHAVLDAKAGAQRQVVSR